ncbi:DUF4158 domain-containing protein [Sphaerisporangium sp. NPDC051011]|uniref:DUF4158 domain-containing protein n=1 Tax=Sphaerisporangium sp. NPDC051011 TaxID=3155792 RepID=UPI0033D105BF
MPRSVDQKDRRTGRALDDPGRGDLIAGKRGATRLAFVILLKFYTRYGRFPRRRGELPEAAVEHVAKQVGVIAADLASYEWSGSTIEYHRSQIRAHLGFRTCTAGRRTPGPRPGRRAPQINQDPLSAKVSPLRDDTPGHAHAL